MAEEHRAEATGAADPPAESEARVRHRLELEFGSREDWDDPKLEWRRLFSELLGTFFLVLVAAGGGILVGQGQIVLAAAVVAPGLMVMAIILFMGADLRRAPEPGRLAGVRPARRLPLEAGARATSSSSSSAATLACLFLVGGLREHPAPRGHAARCRL